MLTYENEAGECSKTCFRILMDDLMTDGSVTGAFGGCRSWFSRSRFGLGWDGMGSREVKLRHLWRYVVASLQPCSSSAVQTSLRGYVLLTKSLGNGWLLDWLNQPF